MATENSKKVFLGVFLVLLALVCAAAAGFYYFEVEPELAARKNNDAVIGESVDTSNSASPSQVSTEKSPTHSENSISLKNLVDKAETVYGDDEKQRKDGFLWFDRDSSKMVVTLGVINGLKPGSHLAVLDGKAQIGKVKVDTIFDVISYVQPLDGSIEQLTGDYYRVVVEQ